MGIEHNLGFVLVEKVLDLKKLDSLERRKLLLFIYASRK